MALDEARVYSRQCFLKSSHIMPFYLQTCVDTYGTRVKFGILGISWLIRFLPHKYPGKPTLAQRNLYGFEYRDRGGG
jgi:hypothetical protein